jgi:hypothetical protein
MEETVELHILVTLPLRKDMKYPLDRRLGGVISVLDMVAKRKFTAHAGKLILDTQSLY